MPKELTNDEDFNNAVNAYQKTIGYEAYQPLSSLLTTLKNLCTLNLQQ
jgi:hypothetical protein